MNEKINKLRFLIVILLLFVLWFILVSSIIDTFRISYGIINLQEVFTNVELSTNLLFLNLINAIRLEGIQIAIAGGFLLLYYSKKRR